jgi:hypothetical protein
MLHLNVGFDRQDQIIYGKFFNLPPKTNSEGDDVEVVGALLATPNLKPEVGVLVDEKPNDPDGPPPPNFEAVESFLT